MNMETNYYVKATTKNGGVIRVSIAADNVFTHCPVCGKEHRINDFIDLVRSGDFDLYGTAIYCERCAKKRIEKGASEK